MSTAINNLAKVITALVALYTALELVHSKYQEIKEVRTVRSSNQRPSDDSESTEYPGPRNSGSTEFKGNESRRASAKMSPLGLPDVDTAIGKTPDIDSVSDRPTQEVPATNQIFDNQRNKGTPEKPPIPESKSPASFHSVKAWPNFDNSPKETNEVLVSFVATNATEDTEYIVYLEVGNEEFPARMIRDCEIDNNGRVLARFSVDKSIKKKRCDAKGYNEIKGYNFIKVNVAVKQTTTAYQWE